MLWESLKERRRDSRLKLVYKGLQGAANIPAYDLISPIRNGRKHHSLALQVPPSRTDIYKGSFFLQTITDLAALPESAILAVEGAKDNAAKFTALARARDQLPFSRMPLSVSPITMQSQIRVQNASPEEEKSGSVHPRILAGYVGEEKISVLACVACPSLNNDDIERTTENARILLPAGVKLCGIALRGDDKLAVETGPQIARRFANVLPHLEISDPVICLLSSKDTRSGSGIVKACILQKDETLVKPQFSIVEEDFLKSFIVARISCQIPLSFQLGDSGDWLPSLHNEIESLQDSICSDSTVFHLQSSNVFLSMGDHSSIPEDATCDYLPSCVIEEESGFESKKKKSEKVQRAIKFDVYHDLSSTSSLERAPSCAPIVNYNLEPHKTVSLTLPIDTTAILDPGFPVTQVAEVLCSSISDQLAAMETCLCQFAKDGAFHTPVPHHFRPMNLPVILTALLPHGLNEDHLENHRKSLHSQLCLPTDRPLFRRSNQYLFPDEQENRGYLLNVHEGLPPSKVKDGTQYVVEGQYTYHHYMQDRFDDNKWGCAYRSLQTLVSWFKLQGFTEASIPTHKEIQQALVDVGDKEQNFIGSRKWIGSMEVSFCLDHLIGVTSKILSVNSGAELAGKGRELAVHFSTQGTPIMIGGGVLAHTILGIDYNEVTGDINFLILDPHYTGAEDLKVIQDKGWCGWKGPDFWDPNVYYNLCMPQRSKVI